jgi:hypothetical protein
VTSEPEHGTPAAGAGDEQRWEEAAALRAEHPQWLVIWLASLQRFRAYRRLPGARRDTVLTAPTTSDLDALIAQAEQDARPAQAGDS